MSSFWEVMAQLMCQATGVPAAGDIFQEVEGGYSEFHVLITTWCSAEERDQLELFKIYMKVHAWYISYRAEAKPITGLHKRWVPCPPAVLHRGAGNKGLNPRAAIEVENTEKWCIQNKIWGKTKVQ